MTDDVTPPAPEQEVPGVIPSDVLTPDVVDNAVLVLVLRPTGQAHVWVSADADDRALADWLLQCAEGIEVGAARADCPACKAGGGSHDHIG